jgi:hypothetical protein
VTADKNQLATHSGRPAMQQFAQRIWSQFHRKALTTSDLCKYVGQPARDTKAPLFSREACDMVARGSGGIPRSIKHPL